MEETTLYKDEYTFVSNARVVMGTKTYALRNITSVNTREIEPNRNLGLLLSVFGIVAFVGVLTLGGDPVWYLIAIVLLGGGLYQIFTAKPTYIILFSSSAGEQQAMISFDKDKIYRITQAVNDAIVHLS